MTKLKGLDKAKFELSWFYNKHCGKIILSGFAGMALGGFVAFGGLNKFIRQHRLLDDPYKNMTTEQVVKEVETYDQAKDYLMRHSRYKQINSSYAGASLDQFHKKGEGVCRDATIAAMALLSDNPRYDLDYMTLESRVPSKILDKLQNTPLEHRFNPHAVALVRDKKTGKYGSLGINSCDCIKPTLDNPEEVYEKVNNSFLRLFNGYYLENVTNKRDLIHANGEGRNIQMYKETSPEIK